MESGFCSIIHDDTLIEKTIINIFIRYFHIFGNVDTIYIFSHCFDGLRLFFLDCPLLQATIVKKDNRTSIKGIFIIVLPFSTSFTCSFLVLCI